MKIELGSPNQIRCFMTSADLKFRNIDLQNFYYGTPGFRNLYKEITDYAYRTFGFSSDNGPMLTEVIPMRDNSLIILITKVDEADELDGRFSDFSTPPDEENNMIMEPITTGNLFGDIKPVSDIGDTPVSSRDSVSSVLFHFQSIDALVEFASEFGSNFEGVNHLYQDANSGFSLIIEPWNCPKQDYLAFLNRLSDYAHQVPIAGFGIISYQEHNELLISSCALQTLAEINK